MQTPLKSGRMPDFLVNFALELFVKPSRANPKERIFAHFQIHIYSVLRHGYEIALARADRKKIQLYEKKITIFTRASNLIFQ
jgi:hypothetical protein